MLVTNQVVDWCMAYPCLNGGTCTTERKDGGQIACVCPSGLTGDRCELDHCHSNPCQNGGRCTPLPDGYECSCSTGYDGSNCETASAQDKDLREQISLLSAQVHFLNQTIGYRVDKAVVTVYDTMLSAQGPRFFREYLEIDHHSITQVKHFRMGSQRYLAAVNTNSRHRHYGIIIYELLDDDTLVHIQTISDPNRPLNIAIKPFSIGGEYFIASANDFNLNSESVNSKLYRWERNRFNLMQTFGTNGSKDVDFISIPNVGSFLAFACYRNSRSFATTSRILFWQPTTSRFISFRKLETTGARKIHFSVANGETYITVASEYDESHHGHSNSSVYRFDFKTGEFLLFQHIPTYRAWDLRLFAVGCQTFLVAANYYNNSSHNTMSVMYRLEKGRFVEHAVLPTKGVVAVEPITIQTENFLAVANSHDEQSAGAKTASMIYKLDGPNVVPFQEIPTRKASHIHSFTTKDGCTALVIADRVGRSKLYKWTRVGVDKSSCCV